MSDRFCDYCVKFHPSTSEYWGLHLGKPTYCRIKMKNYKSSNFEKIERKFLTKKEAIETEKECLFPKERKIPSRSSVAREKKLASFQEILKKLNAREVESEARKLQKMNKERLEYQELRFRSNARASQRLAEEPAYKIKIQTKGGLLDAIKNNSKTGRAIQLLDCSIDSLKTYMSEQFTTGMNWSNHGRVWHVSYIYPLSQVDLTDGIYLAAASNYRNLRPVKCSDHSVKSAKVTPEQEADFQKIIDLMVERYGIDGECLPSAKKRV